MNYRTSSALTVLVVLLTGSLWAHHSHAAVYDVSQIFTVTGTLTKLDWRNPHMECLVEVKDGGRAEVWVIEGNSPNAVRSQISRSDFEQAIGKTVTVEVARAKEGSRYNALAYQITFPDGRSVRMAARPDPPKGKQ